MKTYTFIKDVSTEGVMVPSGTVLNGDPEVHFEGYVTFVVRDPKGHPQEIVVSYRVLKK